MTPKDHSAAVIDSSLSHVQPAVADHLLNGAADGGRAGAEFGRNRAQRWKPLAQSVDVLADPLLDRFPHLTSGERCLGRPTRWRYISNPLHVSIPRSGLCSRTSAFPNTVRSGVCEMQGYNEVRASYNPAVMPSWFGNECRAESWTETEVGTERSTLKLFRKRPLRSARFAKSTERKVPIQITDAADRKIALWIPQGNVVPSFQSIIVGRYWRQNRGCSLN